MVTATIYLSPLLITHLQPESFTLICLTVGLSLSLISVGMPKSWKVFPILSQSVAPLITPVSASATYISMPLYTGMSETTVDISFCFNSSKSLCGFKPTCTIIVPASFQVMAYIIAFPSDVFGVTS